MTLKPHNKNKNTAYHRWQIDSKNHTCQKCNGDFRVTIDHIIPRHLLEALAATPEEIYEWEENFQYLCLLCNRIKSGNLDHMNPKTLPLLRKCVELYEIRTTIKT